MGRSMTTLGRTMTVERTMTTMGRSMTTLGRTMAMERTMISGRTTTMERTLCLNSVKLKPVVACGPNPRLFGSLFSPSPETQKIVATPKTANSVRCFQTSSFCFDHYKIIGVKFGASQDEIKEAYYKLAKLYHPDRMSSSKLSGNRVVDQADERFRNISVAYGVIGNPEKRKEYDANRSQMQKTMEKVGDKADLMTIRLREMMTPDSKFWRDFSFTVGKNYERSILAMIFESTKVKVFCYSLFGLWLFYLLDKNFVRDGMFSQI